MMKLLIIMAAGALAFPTRASYAQTPQPVRVGHFHKVIVSPYIQVTFVQGDEETVTINQCSVDTAKVHVEVHNGTLRLYLDGARDFPHYEKDYARDGSNHSHSLYPKHAIVATVVYRILDGLSLRGEETFLCSSRLAVRHFNLRLYGESTVVFLEVNIEKMHTAMYGESTLDIRSGMVSQQYYTCYGDGKINTTGSKGKKPN